MNHICTDKDTDWTIARTYGIKLKQLHALNPSTDWRRLHKGVVIVISAATGPKLASASPKPVIKAAPTGPKITTSRVKIAKESVIIRSGPNQDSGKITTVSAGTVAHVKDQSGPWYKLKFPHGTSGWVRGDLLLPVDLASAAKGKSATVAKVAKPTTVAKAPKPAAPVKAPKAVASLSATVSSNLLDTARSYLGTRYVYGGTSRSGIDCSGFVGAVYRQHGVRLPRTAAEMYGRGLSIARGSLEAGDLVFFRTNRGDRINHVGLYLGGGQLIHASSGSGRVTVSTMSGGYYDRRYAGARRVAGGLANIKTRQAPVLPDIRPGRNTRIAEGKPAVGAPVAADPDPVPDASSNATERVTQGADEPGN